MWSHGNFYWNELMTRDAEAAKKFYGATLGWTFRADADAARAPTGSPRWATTPVGGNFHR